MYGDNDRDDNNGSDGDSLVSVILEGLKGVGVSLPDDTDKKNLLKRLRVALHSVNRRKESGGSLSDGTERSVINMSTLSGFSTSVRAPRRRVNRQPVSAASAKEMLRFAQQRAALVSQANGKVNAG